MRNSESAHLFSYTVETGYKNIVRSRKTCSYNRFVLIRDKINRGTYRNVSSEDYNRHVLISGVLITGFHCNYFWKFVSISIIIAVFIPPSF